MPTANDKFQFNTNQFQQGQWVITSHNLYKLLQVVQSYCNKESKLKCLVCNIHGSSQLLKLYFEVRVHHKVNTN